MKTGGPAFPLHNHGAQTLGLDVTGMTLRDYFAAKVIQGICSSGPASEWTNERLAAEAYDLADAMLKARDE